MISRIIITSLLLSIALHANGSEVLNLNKDMKYKEVKAAHEIFLQGNPTKQQRVEAIKSIVGSSRYGERGLNNLFRNFEGAHSIDPTIPGVEKSSRLLTSGSKSQAKGYARELVYAIGYHNDPRFTLVEMNRQLGDTDADLVIRHKPTGQYLRVEVKDISENSQKTNTEKYKKQIDKMSRYGRRTGQPQLWMNARPVIPAIERYAHSKGVQVYANVSTSSSPTAQRKAFSDVMESQNQHINQTVRTRSALAGGQFAFGALMLMDAAPAAWDDIQDVLGSTGQTNQALLRLGEHGSYALAGGAMVPSGIAWMASQHSSEKWQSKLYSFGKMGGIFSITSFGFGETFQISRYRSGDISSREFWTSQWTLGVALSGSFGGALIGRLAGLTPCAILCGQAGAVIGGIGGGWLGERLAACRT